MPRSNLFIFIREWHYLGANRKIVGYRVKNIRVNNRVKIAQWKKSVYVMSECPILWDTNLMGVLWIFLKKEPRRSDCANTQYIGCFEIGRKVLFCLSSPPTSV